MPMSGQRRQGDQPHCRSASAPFDSPTSACRRRSGEPSITQSRVRNASGDTCAALTRRVHFLVTRQTGVAGWRTPPVNLGMVRGPLGDRHRDLRERSGHSTLTGSDPISTPQSTRTRLRVAEKRHREDLIGHVGRHRDRACRCRRTAAPRWRVRQSRLQSWPPVRHATDDLTERARRQDRLQRPKRPSSRSHSTDRQHAPTAWSTRQLVMRRTQGQGPPGSRPPDRRDRSRRRDSRVHANHLRFWRPGQLARGCHGGSGRTAGPR